MVHRGSENVRLTRKELRQQTLKTVLHRYDQGLMGLGQEAREEKYRKMAESPFRFFRGSAFLFYYDAAHMPLPFHTPADRPVWIQGDLHFENFGAFQNEKGDLVFDVNDFDEGYPGSYLYDVLRMAVSIVLFSRQHQIDYPVKLKAVQAYLKAYRKQLKAFVKEEESPLSLSFTEENTAGPIRKVLKKLEKKRRMDFLNRVSEGSSPQERRFVESDEIVSASGEEESFLREAWGTYLSSLSPQYRKEEFFYQIKDISVKKGSGTASIGLARYYVMIEGDQADHAHDDVILEVKEVRAPIPAFFLPFHEEFWNRVFHQGQRVVMTQQAMHHAPDPFLGYLTLGDRHFYVRERSPFKKKVKGESFKTSEDVVQTVSLMGRITAKMHARADADQVDWFNHQSEKEILLAMGKDKEAFLRQVTDWAFYYADQVEEDYHMFCQMDLCHL